MKLVVATFNKDKLREMEDLLDLPGVTLVGLSSFQGASAPAEAGNTLLENALTKARAARKLTRLNAIADDTGLEVDVLGGRPGIYSARFAGPNASYADNLKRLLQVMTGYEMRERNARFRTVCAAVLEGGKEVHAEGVLEGRITVEPRGKYGFGYDPVFEIPELGLTLAELTPAEKNTRSHRARAIRALADSLAELSRKQRR